MFNLEKNVDHNYVSKLVKKFMETGSAKIENIKELTKLKFWGEAAVNPEQSVCYLKMGAEISKSSI